MHALLRLLSYILIYNLEIFMIIIKQLPLNCWSRSDTIM